MAKGETVERLAVWHWSGRDRIALHDLEYLVAAPSRHEWRATVLRLRLPDSKNASTVKKGDPRFQVAFSAPGRVFWRELGEGGEWRDEAAFDELRRTSRARELSAGRYADPLHRPEPR